MPQPNFPGKPSPTEALALAEYGVVRELIYGGLKEIWAMERYALVAIAAFWAWLLTQGEWRPWMDVAKYVPAVLAGLAALRCGAAYRSVRCLAEYVHDEIEVRWGLGWEHFLKRHPPGLLHVIAGFWILLIVSCLAAASVFDASSLLPRPKP
jgi:hypothetical protein